MTVAGRDFLFVHVPKSAGKSVAAYLGGTTSTLPSHAPLWYLRDVLGLSGYAFGVVRNPWSRMVSAYAFIAQKPLRSYESAEYQRNVASRGFRDWLLNDAFFSTEDALWERSDRTGFQSRSQRFWLEGCDFICRAEHLAEDLAKIEPHITRPRNWLGQHPKLAWKNRSAHGGFRGYYDDETRDFIARSFAWEIAAFGYSFD